MNKSEFEYEAKKCFGESFPSDEYALEDGEKELEQAGDEAVRNALEDDKFGDMIFDLARSLVRAQAELYGRGGR